MSCKSDHQCNGSVGIRHMVYDHCERVNRRVTNVGSKMILKTWA